LNGYVAGSVTKGICLHTPVLQHQTKFTRHTIGIIYTTWQLFHMNGPDKTVGAR